jgi:hypothetical protein
MRTSIISYCRSLFLFVFATALFSLNGIAMAAGDPSGDGKLREMQAEIEACQQPGVAGEAARQAYSRKYNISMSELLTILNSRKDSLKWQIVCELETGNFTAGSVIGEIVWSKRGKAIDYTCTHTSASYANSFCVDYSDVCPHYVYDSDCAKQKIRSKCFSK